MCGFNFNLFSFFSFFHEINVAKNENQWKKREKKKWREK